MKIKYLFILAAVIIMASCKTSSKAPKTPKATGITQSDADEITKKMGPTTIANLTEGEQIYTAECGVCHGLKKPSARTEDEWKAIVPPMVSKANAKAGKLQINETQQTLILKYLVAMCNK